MSVYIFPSDFKYIQEASQKIIEEISARKPDPGDIVDIKLCFEEAFINAVKHGNGFNPERQVRVQVDLFENGVEISVQDEGQGFDFENCPDPTIEENLRKTQGRGVFLIKKFMDESRYDRNTKCLLMKKCFKK